MLVPFDELIGAFQFLVVVVGDAERLADVLDDVLIGCRRVAAGCFLTAEVGVFDVHVRVATDGTAEHLRHVLNTLADGGVTVSTATPHRPTLDDVFLTLTGTRELEGASR